MLQFEMKLQKCIRMGITIFKKMGAQWLSGRVLYSRPRGRRFKPHRRHCIVSLSKHINPSLVLVQPRKICPYITERLLMGRKESSLKKTYSKFSSAEVYGLIYIQRSRFTKQSIVKLNFRPYIR